MSRVGKLPVNVPENVIVKIEDKTIIVANGKKELKTNLTEDVKIILSKGQIVVEPANDDKKSKAMWGLYRSLISNMVEGVVKGFEKILEINGTGYRASIKGQYLNMYLGHSHSIIYKIPADISVECEKSVITVKGICKQKVGQVSSIIRSFRPLEPYKLKGVKYRGEHMIQKVGKKK